MTLVLVADETGVSAYSENGTARAELEGRPVTHLANELDECWAVADQHALLRREKSGAWNDVTHLDGPAITSILPMPGGVLAGTADARLVRVLDGKAADVTGFDEVDGRDEWHAVGSREPYVRSLTVTADSRALLANVHVGGIARSGNGGATWKPTIDVDADVHQVRAHSVDPQLVLAAAAVGLCVSTDAGATWTVTTDGLHATYLRAVAFTSLGALVSASDGPRTERGALYRRPLDGGKLERVGDGLPEWLAGNVDSHCLDGTRDTAAFADGDAVYVSRNAGRTWTQLADAKHHVTGVVIVED